MKHDMANKMAITKNVRRFIAAVNELLNRVHGIEGMGLLFGEPGEGKTTVIAYVCNMMNGVFIRANACMTVTSLLNAILAELGGAPMHRKAHLVHEITRRLMENPRPIFIDEADYLLRQVDMLDTLRDIYDLTGSPVVLIGMEEIARKIQTNGRFARRITQWIEFKGLDLDDAKIVATTVCEVRVADDLLIHLHKAARANIGRMVVGLSKIDKLGKTNGLKEVTLQDWDDRPLFYDQPTFGKRPALSRAEGGR